MRTAAMKLPRRVSDILKRKQQFIDEQTIRLESYVVRLQSTLFSDIIADLVPRLDIKDGVIQETTNNYKLISTLDRTYRQFQIESMPLLANNIIKATGKISAMSENYFKITLSGNLPARFDKIVAGATKHINMQIGVEGGKLSKGGFLESLLNSNTIGVELKDMISKAVTSGTSLRQFTTDLRNKVTGIDQKMGALERQFKNYTADLYQQYDAAYNKLLGNEFGFKYFIYQGGLINDSRDFCAAHNNKVWSVEEAKTWETWTPADGEYPAGYEVKASDMSAVPSYLGYPGYDPLINRGGYNCRHALGWIPDELAFDMRKDLKEE